MAASVITSIVLISMMLFMSVNIKESTHASGVTENVSAANAALSRMGKVVRTASLFGDGTISVSAPTNNSPLSGLVQQATSSVSTAFPASTDPYYGTGGSLLNNITTWPWGGSPYTLGQTTLIVQVPTFDSNGFPSNPGTANQQSFDTYIYNVLPDSSRGTGYYQLQVAIFPGPVNSSIPTGVQAGQPITLLSGIVGPLDSNGNICVFQYINNQTNTSTPNFTSTPLSSQYNGVVVNLEVVNTNTNTSMQTAITTLRSEMYLRNNILSNI